MEELKEVLSTLPNIKVVYLSEKSEWYFTKPTHVETVEYKREEILGETKVDTQKSDKKGKETAVKSDDKKGDLELS